MFVVRLKRPHEDFDFKAFASRRKAIARLRAAQQEMIDGDVEDCALLEVRTSEPDPRHAIELASHGEARLIESNLADSRTPTSAPTAKLRPHIKS